MVESFSGCVSIEFPPLIVHRVQSLDIFLTNFGKNNFLEFPIIALHNLDAWEFFEEPDEQYRGVFGYVTWGYGTTVGAFRTILWSEPEFINFKNTTFFPNKDREPPTHLRIWARKGVRGNYNVYQALNATSASVLH